MSDKIKSKAIELAIQHGSNPHGVVGPNDAISKPHQKWAEYIEEAKTFFASEEKAILTGVVTGQEKTYADAPINVVGTHEQQTVDQMRNCMAIGNVVGGVLCADGHLGYAQPVGGVIAYENQISVSGVGFDIGCGNLAVKLDIKYADLKEKASDLLTEIRKYVSFGVGRANNEKVKADLFDDSSLWETADIEEYKDKARSQLGTVGSGNHYVDLFRDEDGFVWIGVHFGSRGLGHSIATKYLKLAGGKDGIHALPTVLDGGSEIGIQYIAGMTLAGRYAYAGREWVVEKVRSIVGGSVVESIHNHHNYAWQETHNNKQVWVVRKGATPLAPGQKGFVGGSMGDDAVILEGTDSQKSKDMLYSTIHGAGRLFGRNAAKKAFTREQMDSWLKEKGVTVSGGDLDESPMAYRRLPDVLKHHKGTIKVLHTLSPFAVAMAGEGEFDPWKD